MKAIERTINKLEQELKREIIAAREAELDTLFDSLTNAELEAVVSLLRKITLAEEIMASGREAEMPPLPTAEEEAMIPFLERLAAAGLGVA